ncbi:MAG TPA: prepilin peptidase [Longimicrobiales bacterium]|nr:prepilin peptidase [Longimicrobiales bacterium]
MPTLAFLQFLAMSVMLGIAVVTDVRERRIPNVVTVSGAGVALILAAVAAGGVPGGALLGMVVALAATLPLFALGALGAGDAKLLAAVGAFVGVGNLLPVVLYAGLAGGLLGLVSSIRRGVIIPVLMETWNTVLYIVTLGRRGRRQTIEDANAQTIPYGVAIAAGAMATWFFPITFGGTA